MSTKLSFDEWVAHWGEERLQERIAHSMECHKRMWDLRVDPSRCYSYPAWELALSNFWQQSLDEWHQRWCGLGGELFDGRMIATKSSEIWHKLAESFYDGLGNPYPPYSRSTCVHWRMIDQDEAVVLGVISESDVERMRQSLPMKGLALRKDLTESEKNRFLQRLEELRANRHSREERVKERKKVRAEQFAEAQAAYEERNAKRDREYAEKNRAFRLLEKVEERLAENAVKGTGQQWEWLCESVTSLTATEHFERYPNWRARAWRAAADLHSIGGDGGAEISCLEQALKLNPRTPVKRRLKKLLKEQAT